MEDNEKKENGDVKEKLLEKIVFWLKANALLSLAILITFVFLIYCL